MGTLPSRDPARTAKTQGFNLYIFLQQREFNVFGSKLAKSPQTGTQAKESKMHFEITVKMLRISQDPWAACKTWSSNEFFSAAVLKQKKKASVKKSKHRSGSGTFCIILVRILTVPHWGRRGRLEFFKVQKEALLTNVCFSTAPMDFFAFSHGFQHKKFTFTARPLAHR